MWMTNSLPTADAGEPVDACSIPELSMATWPAGSHNTEKMADGGAPIVRDTSKRSSLTAPSWPNMAWCGPTSG